MSTAELHLSPASLALSHGRSGRSVVGVAAWVLAAALPLVGLVSLLLREQLDPGWHNHQVHFALFLTVGLGVFVLAFAAGGAANRRGDARVLLISLAFLATGGFLGLHALGTAGVLFTHEYAGFKIANPVGLVLAALFALASAFVDVRPSFAPLVVRHRVALRRAVLAAMAVWFVWTVVELPPLHEPSSEGGSHSVLTAMAGVGTVVYAVAAARYWYVYRGRIALLQASVIACFVLLAEAMVGVALTGERAWHASWWEWHAPDRHGLRRGQLRRPPAVARRALPRALPGDHARARPVGERPLQRPRRLHARSPSARSPPRSRRVLNTYYAAAAPLITRRFGGEVEKFIGDGMMATFNSRGDKPDHAVRAAGAALALQRELTAIADANPGWPRLRVGVNSGVAVSARDGRRRIRRLRGRRRHGQHGRRGSRARRPRAAC